MPILENLDLVRVVGRWVTLSGEPGRGTITFTPDQIVVDHGTGEIVLPVPFTVPLDGDGRIDVMLPATNDPDLDPQGWTYTVTEKVSGTTQAARRNRQQYTVSVPHDAAVVDLKDQIPPGIPGVVASRYVTLSAANGDLTLPSPTRTQKATGGVAQMTATKFLWNYTQTVKPTDPSIGTAAHVEWNATINDPTLFGPHAQSGHFGPRGVFNVEGYVKYARNLSKLSIGPLGFTWLLAVGNVPGQNRAIGPGWTFMATPFFIADGATVTHVRNDTSRGAASFCDNAVFVSANGGTWDGAVCGHHGLLSTVHAFGNVNIGQRTGVTFHDLSWQDPGGSNLTPEAARAAVGGALGLTIDPVEGTCEEQIALNVHHLVKGVKNAGIVNRSATAYPAQTVAVTGPNPLIPITATVVDLNNTTGSTVTVTRTPQVPAGLWDGQLLFLRNRSDSLIVFQSIETLAGSGLRLVTPTRRLTRRDHLALMWSAHEAAWVEYGASKVTGDGPPMLARSHNAAQTIQNATWTPVEFNTLRAADHGTHWDQISHRIVPEFYTSIDVAAAVTWAANATGRRKIRILANVLGGLPAATEDVAASGEANQPLRISGVHHRPSRAQPLTDQWLQVQVWQNSGGPLNLTVDGIQSPVLSVTYFRPF